MQVYKSIAKEFEKKREYRKLYFLEAIVQGAMDVHAEMHVSYDLDRHLVVCKRWGGAVAGESAWAHFGILVPFHLY